MDNIQKVNNILTKNCINRLKNLIKNLDFLIAHDEQINSNNFFTADTVFQGLSRVTTSSKNINNNNNLLYTSLNEFGFIIAELVCKKINLNIKKIDRFMWNFYKPGEQGTFHTDAKNNNFYTILYSLNTSDGYVKIQDEIVYDIEDEAKIFKSNLPHMGVGPTKDNYRLNLNIVLET